MILPFRVFMIIIAFITGIITSYSVFAEETVFDRLDGTGPSGKNVDVIEWEGNLEIHVTPKTSLKGLGAKLDERVSGKKVMVIGYRFPSTEKPLVRRAILGIPITPGFKAFVDPTEKDFDKLALSNSNLPKPWVPYKLEPAPKQWYPDGVEDPNEEAAPAGDKVFLGDDNAPKAPASDRAPASAPAVKSAVPAKAPKKAPAPATTTDDDGAIGNFNF